MNPTRLVFGVLLLSLCVFGLPEGCLVFASHGAESIQRPLFPLDEALTFSAQDAE